MTGLWTAGFSNYSFTAGSDKEFSLLQTIHTGSAVCPAPLSKGYRELFQLVKETKARG
jgi:hypothetical protein